MAETEITGESVTFGVGVNRTLGVIQSESDNTSTETAEARDENGKVIVTKAYSNSRERTFEALMLNGAPPPEAGTVVTIGTGESSWQGIVTSSNKTYSNTDFAKVSITASRKDFSVLVAYE